MSVFGVVLVRIWTKNGEIRSISPYSVQMRENTDQNNSEYGHFLLSVSKSLIYKNPNHIVLSWIIGNHFGMWLGMELCCPSHAQSVSPKFLFFQITATCNLINGFLVCGNTLPANISCFQRRLEDIFSIIMFHLPWRHLPQSANFFFVSSSLHLLKNFPSFYKINTFS